MIQEFNPSGVGVKNGNFIGLPYTYENAKIILIPAPWDATVSYRHGTANGPQNILDASYQLDLLDAHVADAWKIGIYFMPINEEMLTLSKETRTFAEQVIEFLEAGNDISTDSNIQKALDIVNKNGEVFNTWVYQITSKALADNKLVGLIGGDHSTPLGYYKALSERNKNFGIFHIDAHQDLRDAYEGFQYSHASIFYNALKINNISKVVQAGIRDYCEAESDVVEVSKNRVVVYYDFNIREKMMMGTSFKEIVTEMIQQLPHEVYISFDIDGLDPSLCPNTGTPVPGGFTFNEVIFMLNQLVEKGKKIIGFDLVEVGGNEEWDGNVGARFAYKMANLMYKSQKN